MKCDKGITLVSLIIYVILMTFVVAGISAVTTSFYNNINTFDKTSENAVAFSRFNMYFLNDIKSLNPKIINYVSGAGDNAISITDSKNLTLSIKDDKGKIQTVTYSEKSGGLYRDNVKICDNIKEVKFTTYQNSKNLVTVYIRFNNYEKTTSYVLEPKNTEDDTPII